MATVKLIFNLDDPDDRMEHLRCIKAADMAIVLFEIHHNLKRKCEDTPAVNEVFEKINELFENNNINLEELIT